MTDPLPYTPEPSPQPNNREEDPRFRLDPWRSPRRLELSLPSELIGHLQALAACTGREVEELIIEALDRKVGELDLHQGTH